MTTSFLFWFGLVGWLVFGYGVLSTIGLIARRSAELNWLGNTFGSLVLTVTTTKALVWMPKLAAACLCCVIGYAIHDLKQFYHTYVLNDLTVLKVNNKEFVIEIDESKLVFSTIFCSDYIPQFKVGTKLKLLVYEDRGDCWSISNKKLGYIIKREEN